MNLICRIFHLSNAKQQANAQLTDENNLKCWYFLLHQFPFNKRNNILSWLAKESQSKRTKTYHYHNCQRPPSCFRRIAWTSRLRATGTYILYVTKETVLFWSGYVKARKMWPLFFGRGVMKFLGDTNNFFLCRCLGKLFFSHCIILQTLKYKTLFGEEEELTWLERQLRHVFYAL